MSQQEQTEGGDGVSISMQALAASGVLHVGSQLKSDRVAAELESRILLGELKTGHRLPTEEALCGMFDVSRSVIRDAVRRLVALGLVTVRQGKGITVAEPSDAAFGIAALSLLARSEVTVGDVIDARAMLETALVPLGAHSGTTEDWAFLGSAYDRFERAVDQSAWNSARDAHLTFHRGLLQALHRPVLELVLRPMTEVIWMSSEPPRLAEAADWEVASHLPILTALKERDPAAVEEAVRQHYAVLHEADRYGSYRSQLFRRVFETPTLSELVAGR